jgi:hypothetical protein
MAKAKTTAGRKTGTTAGARRGVAKGTLEVGNPRRDSGAARGALPRTAGKPGPRKAAAQLPGEKAVRRTGATVPVGPKRRPPGQRDTLPEAALDRRRQVVGTDELPGRPRR